MFKVGDAVCINVNMKNWSLDEIKEQFEGELELDKTYIVEEVDVSELPLLRLQDALQNFWYNHEWFVAS